MQELEIIAPIVQVQHVAHRPGDEMTTKLKGKHFLLRFGAACALFYFALRIYFPSSPSFWLADGMLVVAGIVDLLIHEAGHTFFSFDGMTLHILGGTLFQLFVPLVLAFYLVRKQCAAGVWAALFWFGENFRHIAPYAADAKKQALPLFGIIAGNKVHDWNWLCTQWGLLEKSEAIGRLFHAAGMVIVFSAALGLLVCSERWMSSSVLPGKSE